MKKRLPYPVSRFVLPAPLLEQVQQQQNRTAQTHWAGGFSNSQSPSHPLVHWHENALSIVKVVPALQTQDEQTLGTANAYTKSSSPSLPVERVGVAEHRGESNRSLNQSTGSSLSSSKGRSLSLSKGSSLSSSKGFLTILCLLFFVGGALAQAPSIFYPSTMVFQPNKAITAITPTNYGGAVPASTPGVVTNIAGAAYFTRPKHIAFYGGSLYVTDDYYQSVRKVDVSSKLVTTFAGSDNTGGYADGTGTSALFAGPVGIVAQPSGHLIVAEQENNKIRFISPSGVVTTLAGSSQGYADGIGTAAKFNGPYGLALDGLGNLYISEVSGQRIRRYNLSTGEVFTVAGNGTSGYADGIGTAAKFNAPAGITLDASGNLYVVEFNQYRIRKVVLSTGEVTTFAGNGTSGRIDGIGTAAQFTDAREIVFDGAGNLYVTDGKWIRKIVISTGQVTSLYQGSYPFGIAFVGDGNLYFSDINNNTINSLSLSGYTIAPALPAGLSFDATTGKISGTPTALQTASNYTVTASNSSGSSNFTFSLAVTDGFAVTITAPTNGTLSVKNGATTVNSGDIVPASTNLTVTATPNTGYNLATLTANGSAITNGSSNTLSAATTFAATFALAAPSGLSYASSPITATYGTAMTAASPTVTGIVTSYSVSPGLPYGLSLSSSGVISGTPTVVSAQTNYTVTASNGAGSTTALVSIVVNPKPLTITGATTTNKVYDGTTTASVTGGSLSGVVAPDVVTLTQSGTFASKNVNNSIAITSTSSIGGTDVAKYTLTQPTLTARNITAKALTVTGATTADKVYDGTTAASVTGGALVGIVGTETVTLTQSGTFASKNVGNSIAITSTSSLGGADAGNYTLTQPTLTARNITGKALTVTGATTTDKVYDGTTAASVTGGTLVGVVSPDVVTLTQSGTYANKNVGNSKAITSTSTLGGAGAGNYTLTQPTLTARNITAKALTVTATGVNKVYDGGTTATVTLGDNRVSGDVLTTAYTAASFADKVKATGKAVSVSGISISGTDAGNYTFNTTASATANITAKTLTVTPSATDKVYDGSTSATATLGDDRVSGDVLTVAQTLATFANKNVGIGKTVTVSGISISGADAANYSVATSATTTANITAKTLVVTTTATNKVYDGNTSATTSLLDDRVSGDVLTLAKTASTFDDKNIGIGKTVTVSGISKSGTDAGNYNLGNVSATTTANVTAKALTITASGINKEYDGYATATVNLSDNRVSGDVLTASYTTATFPNKLIGNTKAVSVSGISISGTDAGNYTFNTTASTTANITAKALTITATGINKVYDQNTTATVSLSDNRVSGDVLTSTYTSATFNNKNAGIGKPVNVSGISISGADIGNYTFNTTASTVADITAKPLNVTATAANKVYDGNTTAAVTLADDRISGDVLTSTNTAANFSDKSVDTGKTVDITGISISGTDAANYAPNATTTATADITYKILTITGTNGDKVYDGTTNATVTLTDNRVSGDDLTITYTTAKFPDKNAGMTKKVTVSGISMSGADVQNYMTNNTVKFNANITQRPLTVTGITASDKVYDATTAASLAGGTLSNVISGDNVTLTLGTGSFANKNAGSAKAIVTTGYSIGGTSVANYILAEQPASVTANISRKDATIEGVTAGNKVYDGTTVATLTGGTVSGVISGDNVTITAGTGAFADQYKGTNKPVTASGYSLSGTDGDNYLLTAQPLVPNADITGILLTIDGVTASDKTYDGTDVAILSGGSLVGVLPGDDVTIIAGTGAFNDKKAGSGKTVTATGYSLGGTLAANYSLSAQPVVPNASITKAPVSINDVSASGKTYDGGTVATLTGGTLSGVVSGDDVTIVAGTGAFADKNIGNTKPVTAIDYSLGGADVSNYTLLAQPSGMSADITAKTLTVSGATTADKVYDGNATASVTGGALVGVIGADAVTLSQSANFSDKNVENSKTISSTCTISGAGSGNYVLEHPALTARNITAKALSITATGNNKTYDGSTTATVTLADDRVSGDVLTLNYSSAAFNTKAIANGKSIAVSGISVSGADAGNYTFNTTASTTADITAKALTIAATGINKVYDQNSTATVSLSDDHVSGDAITTSYTSAVFADKVAANGKTVSVSGISISGADIGNYTFNTTATTTADITPKPLSVTATATNKVYDGTTTATVSLSDDRIAGDVLTSAYTSADFYDKNAETEKTVNITGISISGTDAINYAVNTTTTTTADISFKTLTITASGADKVYDGTANASVVLSDNRVAGDVFTASYTSATFPDKNFGMVKKVTVTGISITGADAINYLSNNSVKINANITARPVTITGIVAANKTYDRTTAASLSGGTLSGVITGDVVTITTGTGQFADKIAGNNKSIVTADYGIGGANAGNYTLANQPAGITANILAKQVTIEGVISADKTYDGTAVASLSGGTVSGVISGDVVTIVAGTGAFADKAIALNKTVTATGFELTGADAENYVLSSQPTVPNAKITGILVSIEGVTANNKVYDGTTVASLSGGTLSGVVTGDNITIVPGNGTFADKLAGNTKVVTASGYDISGADAGNYTLIGQPTGLIANITKAPVDITGVTASNKVYDATATATLSGGTLSGVVTGDVVSITNGTGAFADKNAGITKAVTTTGYDISGADAGNYTLSGQPSGLTADITTVPVTITGVTASNKVYNADAVATLSGGTLSGVITGDVVTITNGTGAFADKTVNTAKPITAKDYSISGADAGNYTLLAQPTGLTADIIAVTLDITGVTASNKVYDGTTAATMNSGSLSGVIGSDVVTLSAGSASFADKSVNNAKAVTASGFSLSGADAGNYLLSGQPTGLTANITKAPVDITGVTASNKVYDALTTATLTGGTLSGVVTGDVVTITNGTGAFADKTVNTAKVVTATGFDISGADAGNYTLSGQPSGLIADITSVPVTITGVTASNKVYDATSTAALSGGTLSGVITGDVVTITDGTGTFADKNVNTTKPVTAKDYAISGTDAGNYTLLAQPTGLTADITAVTLDITGVTASNKVYDGTTAATMNSGSLSGVIGSDVVTLSAGSASFADKSVNNAKAVTASGFSLSGADAGNYLLSGQPTGLTANITKAPVDITGVTASNKVYDALTTATLTGGTLSGVITGDVVTITNGTGAFADKNAGITKAVTTAGYDISGADAGNYTLSGQPTGLTADITSAPVTITGVTASNKVYNALTTATLSGGTLSGVITGDVVTITDGTGAFADKTVNTAKPITAKDYAISGADAGNYTLSAQPLVASADITALTLDITGVTASNKVYDGTTAATMNSGSLSGVLGSDVVTLSAGSASFADKNVNNAKAVTASGFSLSGADAGNYILSGQPSGLTAKITKALVTITGVTASNKVYDALTTATLTGGTLSGVITGDVVTITNGTGAFADKNAGISKAVTATGYDISGADAGNYVLSGQPSGLTADITAVPVTITGVTASNKVYDANAVASLSGGTLSGVITGDVVTITDGTGAFADKNVNTAKPVTAKDYAISGADAGNYTLSAQPTGLTADITAVTLDITGVTASNKVYDGTTAATMNSGSLSGVLGSDDVTLSAGSASFADKSVGDAKAVTASGFSLSGADAGNYVLSGQPTGLTAKITKALVTITGVTAANKVYNALTTATLSGGTLSGVITGDVVTITNGTGAFADKTVNTAKAVTATGYDISGADAGNYTLSGQPTGLTADITSAPVTITGVTASNKVYDADAVATLSGGTVSGVITGDVVTITDGTGAFADKTVNTAKPVTAKDYSISGADAGNYTLLAQPTGLTADITAVTLDITGVTASNKVYDGTTAATMNSGSLSGVLGSDVVTLSAGSASFADKSVGDAKAVTASGFSLSGTDAGNYILSGQPSGLTANITKAPVTITGVAASNKVYDALTTATLTGGTLSGVITGDVVTITDGTGAFADKTVNTAKPVTATGYDISGADAGNYTLSGQPSGLTADITSAPVTITGVTASNKVYDANAVASLSGGTLSGVITGDVVTITDGTGAFADKTVNTAKPVTAKDYSISGADAGNYTLSAQPTGLTADITAVTLDITGVTASNKVYDGTTAATMNSGSLSGVLGSDVVTLSAGSASFADKSVGDAKAVTASGFSLSGADAGNYVLSGQPTGLTANITKAPVTITGVTASNKVYDALTTATLTGGTLSGVITGDVVTITNGTGAFADKTVNTAKAVTTTGYDISGADAGNYTLSGQPSGLTADITSAPVTITGVTASNKVYDANTTASLSGGTLSGVITGDVVTIIDGTGAFADKNVNTAKPVTAKDYAISGADAGNYTLSAQPLVASADITAVTLDITGVTASNKVYDGTTAATMNSGSLSGVLGSDAVTLSAGSASFADKSVGDTKAVTASGFSLSGADAGNYVLSGQPSGLTANITKAPVDITGVTASNKVYDALTTATLSGGTLSGVIIGDVVTITNGTGAFADKTVNTAKVVTATGFDISGADAGNYTLSGQPTGLTADITSAPVSFDVVPMYKYYDGGTTAVLAVGPLTGIKSGDAVTLTDGTGIFSDKNVGRNKTVTVTGFGLAGADALNYTLSAPPSGLTTDIYPAPLTIFVQNKSKTYGSPNPEFTFSYTGLVGGETVNELNLKATCNADISSKVGKYTISVNTGNVSNYETYSNLDGILEITKATLTVTAEDKIRVAGGANPEFTLTYQGFKNNETVSSIAELPTASTVADAASPAGEYPIIASGGLSDNYTFSFINGKLLITSVSGDTNGDGKITDPEKAGDTNGDGKITSPEIAGDTNGDGKITYPEIAGDTNGDGKITDPEIAGDTNGDGKITYPEIAGDTNGDGKITDPEKAGDTNGDGKITYPEIAGDTNGDGKITSPEIAGDTNGDGKITYPEIAGDTNGDGKITDPEKAGDTNGDGKITYPEIAGDTNGDGKITYPEIAGDTNGDGKITYPEIAGDTNGDGKITDPEKAGDTNGDGKITDPEKAGDTNGDGKITSPEIAGDTNGDGKITSPEIAGDTNGDGKITYPEIAGDTNGDGKITDPEKAGDTNGDGKITDPEIAGDTNGDGKITDPEIAGDTNGDGKITDPEKAGDTNGDGKITDPEIAGDTNGDGKITDPEKAGDTNGDGKITDPEIAGDTNGDGKITDPEKAGDTNGDGKITSPEILGDTNGDGKIGSGETTGDANGDGKIDNGETSGNTGGTGSGIAGDTNGDGKITYPEIAGDTNGDGKITDPEKAGDTNGDGRITDPEIAGDTNGDGKITSPEIAGDTNGDGKITYPEIAGDTNGDGKITYPEIAGDTNGDGKITYPEIAGDTNGDGKITDPEKAGDTNGDGKITDPEKAGDTNGDGKITSPEILGDTNGDGKIGSGETTGDANGDGKIDNGETSGNTGGTGSGIAGDTNGDGKITYPEIAGDTNGDGKITDPEIAGDTNGDGKITSPEIAGDTNGDGKITDPEKAGDTNGDGKITYPEIAGDTNGDGRITDPEKAGDTNGDGKITYPEIAGDTNGDGKITSPEIAGDTNGDGKITYPEIAGDTNGDGKITYPEIAGDTNGDGKITSPEIAGDINGDGKIGSGETAGDDNGDGKITSPEIAGDANGDGKITYPEIAGDTNGDGKITDPEIAGDTNGDGKITYPEIAGDTNGDGKITSPEIAGDTNGDGKITSPEIKGDINGNGHIDGNEIAGDSNGDGTINPDETRVIDPDKDHLNVNHLFSPNGDGINDYWKLPEIEQLGRVYVKIYDRWGTLIYESTNYQNDWDGTSKGKAVPEGGYIYFIKTEKAGNKTGVINLIR